MEGLRLSLERYFIIGFRDLLDCLIRLEIFFFFCGKRDCTGDFAFKICLNVV